jgi:CBS domain-containing protein
MRVADLMKQPVVTIGMDTSVQNAIVMLADDHISALPVTDGAGRMIGVLSATDILAAEAEASDEAAREQLFATTTVRDVMTPRPLTITPDTEIKEAAQQMLYADVHRLFVTDGDHVVGVVSTTDIVRAVAQARV